MSSSRFLAVLLLAALVSLLSAAPSAAQTNVYFYYSGAQTPPYVCTTGVLSCTQGTGSSFTCSSVVSGTHYYYPSSGGPTFVSNLLTGAQAAVCEGYAADNTLPLTGNGLGLAYGSTAAPVCVNLRILNATTGTFQSDPDAQAGAVTFNYSTSNNLPSCPTAIPVTSSSSANLYFVYTSTSSGAAGSTNLCGTGQLLCTSYGSNQYACTSLVGSGVEYRYNYSTNTTTSSALTGITECNGFGDGYLPLDYEGISFSLASSPSYAPLANCISWYGEGTNSAGVTSYGYDYYNNGSYISLSGTKTFSYSTTAQSTTSACSNIPYLVPVQSGAWQLAPLSLSLLSLILAMTIATFTFA